MYTGGKNEFDQQTAQYDNWVGDGDGPPKDVTSVTFDTDVTEIGDGAFKDCTKLTTVTIPSSVTEIGGGAFDGCTGLTTVAIPSSVTEIGSSVFRGCTKLATVAIPSSVTEIGEYAFYGCIELTTVAIPSSVTEIGMSAFQGCTGMTTVAIPSSVTKIVMSAFQGCTGLTTVAIPSALTKVGDYAFYGCTSLLSVNLPSSVTSVNNMVFNNCPFLQKALDAQTKHGDMIKFIRHRFDDLPLHEFCHQHDENSSPSDIKKFLVEDAAEKVDSFGMTPLHLLAGSSMYDTELFQTLLDYCPLSASETDVYGNTPMHYLFLNIGNGVTKEVMLKHTHAVLNVAPETVKQANADQDVPLVFAIRSEMSLEVRESLFAHYPIGGGVMDNDAEIDQLREVAKEYIARLSSKKSLSRLRQNAWVTFVSSDNILSLSKKPKKNELVEQVARLVKECKDTSDVEVLAYAKDSYGRTAIEVAVPEIKIAMQKRLLFLGRYDIVKGPPIHKSATSVILKAYDAIARDEYELKYHTMKEHNVFTRDHLKKVLIEYGMRVDDKLLDDMMKKYDIDSDKKLSEDEFVNFCTEELDGGHKRTIVLKFFSNKTQFDREVDSRGQGKDALDKKFVVQILEKYDLTDDKLLHKPPPDLNLEDYKYIITMPYADRNLDTIFRSERLDKVQTCSQAKEILEAISHLHENNIIHGDIKLLNIVRIQGSLSLIDFDASSKKTNDKNQTFIGSKFSSGVLPPEMIVEMTDSKEIDKVEEYFKSDAENNIDYWNKIKPKESEEAGYMIKTFRTHLVPRKKLRKSYEVEEPLSQEELPYELENATEAIDMWSYGALLFTLLTGYSLFKVDRDDDLENENEMATLKSWDETVMSKKLKDVKDLNASNLLGKLLHPDPNNRISATKAIEHPYFKRDNGLETENTTALIDMTGLLNQQKFQADKSEWELKAQKTLSAAFAIDVANFKEFNEKTTHEKGDTALKILALQIKEVAQTIPGAKAYHSGGDEFQVLARCQGNELEFTDKVKFAAEKLSKIEHEMNSYRCFLRIGVACFLNTTYEQADLIEKKVKAGIMKSRGLEDREPADGIEPKERYLMVFEPFDTTQSH